MFPLRNPLFGLATGILYLALAWLMPPPRTQVWAEGDTALARPSWPSAPLALPI